MSLRIAVAALFLFASPVFALNVSTLAGSTSGGGHVDATGFLARFSAPRAIAVDAAGNFYVADTGNHVIRKITSSGEVTTLAGMPGVEGYADGTGPDARFRFPHGVAVDPLTGHVFVSDSYNHAIRRITAEGVVTTFAGLGGTSGTANGTGTAARFAYPFGIAFDSAGVLYVADVSNHVIRKITRDGAVTTLAGRMRSEGDSDGFGTQAAFRFPYDVAVDPTTGNLFVGDADNNTVRKVTLDGRVTTVAGNPIASGDQDGTGSDALFDTPWGVVVDSAGNAYVTDNGNQKIRRITPAGVVSTIAGSGSVGPNDGPGASARFINPSDVVIGPDNALYVADTFNMAIRRVDPATGEVATFAGSKPANGTGNGTGTAARFHFPHGVAVDAAGNTFVSESSGTIRKITPDGVVSVFAGAAGTHGAVDGPALTARFRVPRGLTFDPSGNLYVADTANHIIRKITPAGVVSTFAGVAGEFGFRDGTGSQARFYFPWDVESDSLGNIYVADGYNHAIRMIEPSGVVTTFAGDGIAGYFDGTGRSADFRYPLGIGIDAARNLYIADWGNDVIRKITQAGVVTTLAGDANASGWADGTGKAARFSGPEDIAVDANGNLYVTEDNHLIRKVTPAGVVTTVAGLWSSPGNVNGGGSVVRFTWPEGIVFSPKGELVIADTYNHAIRIATIPIPRRRTTRH